MALNLCISAAFPIQIQKSSWAPRRSHSRSVEVGLRMISSLLLSVFCL